MSADPNNIARRRAYSLWLFAHHSVCQVLLQSLLVAHCVWLPYRVARAYLVALHVYCHTISTLPFFWLTRASSFGRLMCVAVPMMLHFSRFDSNVVNCLPPSLASASRGRGQCSCWHERCSLLLFPNDGVWVGLASRKSCFFPFASIRHSELCALMLAEGCALAFLAASLFVARGAVFGLTAGCSRPWAPHPGWRRTRRRREPLRNPS